MNIRLDAETLREAVWFDDQRTLDANGGEILLTKVSEALLAADASVRLIPSRRAALCVVLANLLVAARRGKPLAIPLDKNYYSSTPKHYRIPGATYGGVTYVVNSLESAGLLMRKSGMKNRTTGVGFRTRIAATDKLLELVKVSSPSACIAVRKHPNAELIILKDQKKRLIDYRDTATVNRMKSRLVKVNNLLQSTEVAVPGIGTLESANKTLYRVFNNSSFKQGGRFYGGEWQSLPKADRKNILIDGQPTIERDYAGMHVKILYEQAANIDYTDDPYQLPGYENARDALKKVLLICINAKSKQAAQRAILNDKRDNPADYPEGFHVKTAVDAFLDKHSPIADRFFDPKLGVKLQRLDAKIADGVMSRMTAKKIAVLPIHDSFIVKKEHEEQLVTAMGEVFEKHAGVKATIHYILAYLAHSFPSPTTTRLLVSKRS